MSLNLADLKKLKKNSKTSLSQIAEAMTKQNERKSYDDDRLWSCVADKAGNGSAVIRFLPAHPEDELPYIKTFSHGFQGPTGQWYIENCLTTIGKEDPVVTYTQENIVKGRKWDTLPKADQDLARKYKRKIAYYFNVLIIDDPSNPENNGQVRIFKCGPKIYEMVMDKINPQFEDIDPINVFDPWEGANFRLRMRRVEGYANFDKSSFDGISTISDDDDELLDILNKRYRLGEFIDSDKFKSYEELEKRLNLVLGNNQKHKEEMENVPVKEERKEKVATTKQEKTVDVEDDDDMEFFKGLVDDEDDIPF